MFTTTASDRDAIDAYPSRIDEADGRDVAGSERGQAAVSRASTLRGLQRKGGFRRCARALLELHCIHRAGRAGRVGADGGASRWRTNRRDLDA